MDLLKYEFMDAPVGSYNFTLGELVRQVRHYRSNVSADEFKAAIPKLKLIEHELQDHDALLGDDSNRLYIHEIMNELDVEDEIPQKVIEESERLSKAITKEIFNAEFSIEDFHYEMKNKQATQWMEFHGYVNKQPDSTLLVLKDVFRAVCYKYNIIFVDFS